MVAWLVFDGFLKMVTKKAIPLNESDCRELGKVAHRWYPLILLYAVFGFSVFGESELRANDYVVTIGGGYEPAGNQASLEANVLFFQKLVEEHLPETSQHQVFFADGWMAPQTCRSLPLNRTW